MAGEQGKQVKSRAGGLLAGAVLGAAGAWMLYSRYGVNHRIPLAEAISAPRLVFEKPRLGSVSYYAATEGAGTPLVLLHGMNVAASAYEMLPLFNQYRGKRPVYALDWPGFGFSERSRRIYSAQFFQEVLNEFLAGVVGAPADVVALSTAGEFTARAALAKPGLFHSLTLLSPTGLSGLAQVTRLRQPRAGGLSNVLHPLLSFRLWALPIFDLLSSRSSIEYFLRQSFTGAIPTGMVEYAYASAHQPGAEYAPLYFLAGKMFTPQISSRVYEKLNVPALALYDSDPYVSFAALPELLLKNHRWQAVRLVPSRGMPHWERLADTCEVLEVFWKACRG